MRNSLRTLLFISAFSPALLTLAYVRYDASGWQTEVMQLLIIGLLGLIIPIGILRLVANHGESFSITAKKIESNDFMLLAFIGSYLIPFVMNGSTVTINEIAGLLGLLGIILWLIGSLPVHPLLRILQFKFYKLESSTGMVYILISKRVIIDPSDIRLVKKISDNMLMEA